MKIEQVINKTLENNPQADVDMLRLAFDFADKAHEGQLRKTGEPYIQHSLHTAYMLAQIKSDLPTIMAGILHDVPEDTKYTLADIRKNFGDEIAFLVKGITKLGKIKYRGVERYRESLRKMFMAMAEDLRVILIKFCDRLHNLKTLDGLPIKKQQRIAKETLEIYAPIAGLLGVDRLKWQMEDICFKYLYNKEYRELEYKYEIERKFQHNQFIQQVKNTLESYLERENISNYYIESRMKHLYSIYLKMENKSKEYKDIFDVFALRVITENVSDCYKILDLIHNIWTPKMGKFKDYIATPKPNGYKSLHTTVFGPEGKPTEFQIRTRKMDDEAKYGIAAHWHYKGQIAPSQDQPQWVREILEMQKNIKNTDELIKQIKLNVFQKRIFVFSPKGDVFELPKNSTPVDFAYAVHTEIGDKISHAIVNEKMATLDRPLKNGDMVEIRTDKNRKAPSYDWLKFVKTKKAREKIKQNENAAKFNIKRFFSQ